MTVLTPALNPELQAKVEADIHMYQKWVTDRKVLIDGVSARNHVPQQTVEELYLTLYPEKPADEIPEQSKIAEEAAQPASVQDAPPQKSNIRTIAERSIARGENRVLPIAVGGKNPAISWKNSPIDVASTSEWAGLAQSWIDSLDQQFPELNACVIAKPDEYVFIDNDTAKQFREGYEKFSGEQYPETFTTSATPNHYQEHFRQTDLTRAMGNVVQFSVDGISLSVRQRNRSMC